MATVFFDWSIRNGVFTLTDDDENVVVYPTLESVIDKMDAGDTLIGEATFQSFNLDERLRLMQLAASRGINFLTTPNRLTSRARIRHRFGSKSDESDVRAIRALALERDANGEQHHLKPPASPDPFWIKRRERANRHLMALRRSGTLTPAVRTPNRFSFTSQKEITAAAWAARLPLFSGLSQIQQLALGSGRDYSLVIVAAVGVAAIYARDTDEFDRLAGLYAHGYPSQIRADLHHYAWAGGNTRAKLVTVQVEGHRTAPSPTRRHDGLRWSDYRRELRWLYRQLREIVEVEVG